MIMILYQYMLLYEKLNWFLNLVLTKKASLTARLYFSGTHTNTTTYIHTWELPSVNTVWPAGYWAALTESAEG